jgi:hypothetical protein
MNTALVTRVCEIADIQDFDYVAQIVDATLKAHAERTGAARSGEPEEVAAIRYVAKYHDMRRDVQLDRLGAMNVVEYLDTLTAELAALREEGNDG